VSADEGLAARAIDASRALLGDLPPAFLLLVLLNVAFLGMVLWFLTAQIEQRTAIVGRVIDVCVAHMAAAK
jgi:hypothetical protein